MYARVTLLWDIDEFSPLLKQNSALVNNDWYPNIETEIMLSKLSSDKLCSNKTVEFNDLIAFASVTPFIEKQSWT